MKTIRFKNTTLAAMLFNALASAASAQDKSAVKMKLKEAKHEINDENK